MTLGRLPDLRSRLPRLSSARPSATGLSFDEFLALLKRAQAARLANEVAVANVAPAPAAPRPQTAQPTPFALNRPRTEIGGFPGSGVIENALTGLDRLAKTGGGIAGIALGEITSPGGPPVALINRLTATQPRSVIPPLAELQENLRRVRSAGVMNPFTLAEQARRETTFAPLTNPDTRLTRAISNTPFIGLAQMLGLPRPGETVDVGGLALDIGGDPLNVVLPGASRAISGAGRAVTRAAAVPQANRFFRPHFTTQEIFQRQDRLHTLANNPPVPNPVKPSEYSGALGWVIERGGGRTRVVNPDDALGKAFVLHETRKQQAAQLAPRLVADFRTRFTQNFAVDANGNVTNVGAVGLFRHPGRPGSPLPVPQGTNINVPGLPADVGRAPGQFRKTSFQTSQVFEDAFDTGIGNGGSQTLIRLPLGKLRNPKHGYDFAPEQVRLIQDVHTAVQEATDWARRVGVDIGTAVVSGAGSRPVPRQVIGRMRVMARDAQQALITKGGGLGSKQRFQHDRFYIGQEIYDAVANGVRYESDIGNIVETFYAGIYRAARDFQLARDLEPVAKRFGGTTKQRKTVLGAIKQLRTTGDVPAGALKNVAKLANDPALPQQSQKIIQGTLDDINAILQVVDPAQRKRLAETLSHEADLRLAREPLTGEMAIGDPLFRGKFFDPAIGKKIVEQTQGATGTVKVAGDVGDLIVTASATGDFSSPFIQAIFLLANDALTFAKGLPRMFKAFALPETYAKYLAANSNLYDRLPGLVVAGRHELYAGIGRQGLLQSGLRGLDKALGLPGKGPGEILTRLFQRFDTAFSFFGDYARTEMAEAMLPLAERARVAGNARALQQLEDVVNKMTGVFSPGSLIQTPTQSAIERAALFFAPRYTRALAATVGAVAKGDLQGHIARRSMAKLIGGGMLTYFMLASALDQKPALDPRPKSLGGDGADFLSIQVGGDRIGIGSGMIAMLRFFAGIAADPALSGDIKDSPLLFTSTDPGGRATPERIGDNPLFRFWRSRMAPLTGNAWDVATGHDFIGNPVEGPIDLVKHLGSSVLPFAVEAALLAEPTREGPAAAIAGVFGLRTFPMSLSARRNEVRDQEARARGAESWDRLNRLAQERAVNENAELAALTERARQDRVVRGRQIDQLVDEYFGERDRINEQWRAAVEAGIRQVGLSVATPGDFRLQVLTEANKFRRGQFDALQESTRFAPVIEYFNGLDKRPGRSPELPEDIAYDEYLATALLAPELDDDATLGFNFREQERRIADFRARWGPEVFQYVQDRLAEGRTLPPIVQELTEGRERFRFFYGSTEEPNSVASRVIAARNDSEIAREIYRQWESLPRNSRAQLENEESARGEVLRGILNTIRRVRGKLRDKDPELDAFLFRWGYTETLSHPANGFDGARQVALDPRPRTHWRLAGM